MSVPKITKALIAYFNEQKLKFEYMPEKKIISSSFSIRNKVGMVNELIVVRNDGYTVYAGIDLHADEATRAAMAEYLTRANYGLRIGNFELDYADGEIRYKVHMECGETIPDEACIEKSIFVPLAMIERYGNGIGEILFGSITPEEAVRMAETNSGGLSSKEKTGSGSPKEG